LVTVALKDFAKGAVDFTYQDGSLCLFFSPNRVAQLKMVPADQRQNVIAEMANRFMQNPELARTTVVSDMIVWDILREEGWAFPKKEKQSSLSTIFRRGETEFEE
jgi:hypothetical protein